MDTEWDITTDVSQCYTVELVVLNDHANELHYILNDNTNNNTRVLTTEFDITEVKFVSDDVTKIIKNTESPILPNDLTMTNDIVNTLIR